MKDKKGKLLLEVDNPLAESMGDVGDEELSSPTSPSLRESTYSGKQVEFSTGLTEDELGDLTFAFQACDLDQDGKLEVRELQAMMACLAQTDIAVEAVQALVKHTKASFVAWLEPHDDDAALPDVMQVDSSRVHGEVSTTKDGVSPLRNPPVACD